MPLGKAQDAKELLGGAPAQMRVKGGAGQEGAHGRPERRPMRCRPRGACSARRLPGCTQRPRGEIKSCSTTGAGPVVALAGPKVASGVITRGSDEAVTVEGSPRGPTESSRG